MFRCSNICFNSACRSAFFCAGLQKQLSVYVLSIHFLQQPFWQPLGYQNSQSQSLWISTEICHNLNTQGFAVFAENFLQPLIIHLISKIFDVNIGEFMGFVLKLGFSIFAAFESANKQPAVLKQCPIHLLNGLSAAIWFESARMHSPWAVIITHHLGGQDLPRR